MARAHATKYFDSQRAGNSALRPGGRPAQRQTRAPIAAAQRAKRRVEAMRPCAPRATPLHACTLLLFSLLLPASEDASHTVHFITSACSTNLLSGQAGYEATEVQQISKLRASLAQGPASMERFSAFSATSFTHELHSVL